MSTTIFLEKRTRSQVTLPDQILQQLSQRSPLKDARTALRNNTRMHAECSVEDRIEEVEETDDELLLSPRKVLPVHRAKRSASPPARDEYSSHLDTPMDGRELKRVKRDTEPTRNGDIANLRTTFPPNSTPTHSRSLSQPEAITNPSRARAGTASGMNNRGTSPVETTRASGKGRAQSVPLFPSASSSTVIHIDLRNPPPSPRHARSRSPSKEREFRIVSGPALVPRLDSIPDEANSGMSIAQDAPEIPTPRPPPQIPKTHDPPTITLSEDIAPILPIIQVRLPTIDEMPSTPATQRETMSFMSPLTPLPETPNPLKLKGVASNRYTGLSWRTDPEEEDEDNTSSLVPPISKAFPTSGAATQSRLPRPSSAMSISSAQGSVINSARPTSKPIPISSMAPPPIVPTEKSLPPASAKLPPAVADKIDETDAFAVLLEGARKMKGKGKEKASSSKVASSSSTAVKPIAGKTGSSKTHKSKLNDATKMTKEVDSPRVSIKAKMRPKGKPKAKPVPVPVPMPSYDSEFQDKEPRAASSRTPSPIPTLQESHPPTPPTMDVSMEFLDAPPMAEPTHSVLSSTAEVCPNMTSGIMHDTEAVPSETPLEDRPFSTTATVPIDHQDVNTILDDVPPTDPTPNHPPVSKPSTKKPHIPKRMPTAPVERVTRSVSSRLGKTQSELSRPLQRTTHGKQVSAQKKSIPSILPMASGSSTYDTVMKPEAASDFPYDTGASTSSLSSLPTDPITDPPLLPDTSVKLSSPAKKMGESSFARSSRSVAAKKVLPNSPVKANLAKSSTPSPKKLVRAASMFTARATATGLSRTFSGLGANTGGSTSLSTLSTALEKLRMPPPGRPNTSMGFNRDIDSDTSLELKQDSKDDTAIGQLSSKPAAGSSKAPSRSGTGGHLVQKTLISSGHTSGAGKTIFGSGTIMRGPGGFRGPGNSLKTGSRAFGAGGGTFSGAVRARTMQKASRKTSLPSVMASPIKGGGGDGNVPDDDDDMAVVAGTEAEPSAEANKDVFTVGPVARSTSEKRKEKERPAETWRMNASMRVSMASHALSQSLSSLPPKEPGLMGPPATPVGRAGIRSSSSSYPSTSSAGKAPEKVSPNTRSMTMALRSAAGGLEKTKGGVEDHVSSGKKAAVELPDSLKILKDCVIFVDVRTDDGDEAGSLFVEMLESVGARVLTRVGQTCTHIVFKNGLMSTLTRYRLLRDPKPLAVGIGWVVECVEQGKQVDETKFLVDLDGMNVSGTNKRRRSMLPKLISRDLDEMSSSDMERDREGAEGDVSLDGSTSSLLNDGLTPLEKARRRKVIIT